MTTEELVDEAVGRRSRLVECRPRPWSEVMSNTIEARVRRAPSNGAAPTIAAGGPAPVAAAIAEAVHRRFELAQATPRPFDQVVRPAPGSTPTSAPQTPIPTTSPPESPTPRTPSSPPPSPVSTPPPTAPAPTVPATPAVAPPAGPSSPKPGDRFKQASRGGKRVGRIGRAVRLVVVGSVVAVASVSVWFFWGEIRCAFADEPGSVADACAPPTDSLRAAANDLLDAINNGDVARIRSHLATRCSPTDRELTDAAAGAAARSPKITTVSAAGRGGTVAVRAGGQEYTTVWTRTGGGWRLQVCDALDRLAG